MARGIIYIMTTVVPGLIKIGKTGIENFESRMYQLERHGYSNVVGLQRRFAIAVDDYNEKEILLDDIFSKSQVPNTELFALDVDLVVQLLSSFDGEQVFPKKISKEETFIEATKERSVKSDWARIPDGHYYLSENVRGFGKVEGTMRVEEGVFTVLKGSKCAPTKDGWIPESRKNAPIIDNVLLDDVSCNSPTTAAWIVLCSSRNGWLVWKDSNGTVIDSYRVPHD